MYKVQPELVLYGLAGSELTKAGEKLGLRTAHEVFADRTYQANGTLTPRRLPDALITSADAAIAQVLRMVQGGGVRTQQGPKWPSGPIPCACTATAPTPWNLPSACTRSCAPPACTLQAGRLEKRPMKPKCRSPSAGPAWGRLF